MICELPPKRPGGTLGRDPRLAFARSGQEEAQVTWAAAHKPDPAQRRQVNAMAAYGIPADDISRVVGIGAAANGGSHPAHADRDHARAAPVQNGRSIPVG